MEFKKKMCLKIRCKNWEENQLEMLDENQGGQFAGKV